MSTFWVSPMAPSSTVPTRPARARAGEAGRRRPHAGGVPSGEELGERRADQLGNGTNWPTTGSRPPRIPRVPMTTISAATSQAVSLVRPDSWPPPAPPPAPPARPRRPGRPGRSADSPEDVASSAAPASTDPGRWPVGVVGRGQLVGVGTVEPVLEDPPAVGGQPGAAAHLEQPDLLVAQPAVALELLALAADGPQATEVPPPGPDHRPGPGPVAGQLGHDDLAHGQHEDLGHHPDQVERAVALEHGQELVAALELLEGHRVAGSSGILATDQGLVDWAGPRRPAPRGGAPGRRGRR